MEPHHDTEAAFDGSGAGSARSANRSSVVPLESGVSAETIAETLIALANSRGGSLLLNIADSSGVEDALDRVNQALLRVEPALILPIPEVTFDPADDIAVISVTVPHGLSHVFALDGRYLTRKGNDNWPLSPRELRRLLIERGDLSYEEEIATDATLDDLDWRAIEAYLARLGNINTHNVYSVLAQRGCLVKRGKGWVPTNAGVLLFGTNPQRFVRGAFITAARFAGVQMSDTFTRQDIGGPLPGQILQAETFLLDNLRRGVFLGSGMERVEQLEYPMEAARELVVNAVSHRDYSIQGDGIRLFLFADRLDVTSPGCLPGPVTVANIVDERYSRNSIIVQVLSDMGFIERLGYGVDRVIVLMQDRGLMAPEFAETSGGFRVRLFNTLLNSPRSAATGSHSGIELNPRQESALRYLAEGDHQRITNKDLQELFTDVHPETIRRDLADLVNKGLLIKRGQKRGSYYVLHNSGMASQAG